jgi:hypothetical protein
MGVMPLLKEGGGGVATAVRRGVLAGEAKEAATTSADEGGWAVQDTPEPGMMARLPSGHKLSPGASVRTAPKPSKHASLVPSLAQSIVRAPRAPLHPASSVQSGRRIIPVASPVASDSGNGGEAKEYEALRPSHVDYAAARAAGGALTARQAAIAAAAAAAASVQHPHHRHRSSWDLLGRSGPERDWTGRSYDELRTARAEKEAAERSMGGGAQTARASTRTDVALVSSGSQTARPSGGAAAGSLPFRPLELFPSSSTGRRRSGPFFHDPHGSTKDSRDDDLDRVRLRKLVRVAAFRSPTTMAASSALNGVSIGPLLGGTRTRELSPPRSFGNATTADVPMSLLLPRIPGVPASSVVADVAAAAVADAQRVRHIVSVSARLAAQREHLAAQRRLLESTFHIDVHRSASRAPSAANLSR